MVTTQESEKNMNRRKEKQEKKEKREQEKKEKKEKREKDKKEKKEKEEKKAKKGKVKKEKEKKGKKAVEMPVYSEFELNGTVYKTTFPAHFQQNKKWKRKDIGAIESVITGIVKEIFVKNGDSVAKGDCLLLLEAMKMNNEILSPIDGTVQEVFVSEQSKVAKGTLMVKIEPNVFLKEHPIGTPSVLCTRKDRDSNPGYP